MFLLKRRTMYINLCEKQNFSPLVSFTQTGYLLVRAVKKLIESLALTKSFRFPQQPHNHKSFAVLK